MTTFAVCAEHTQCQSRFTGKERDTESGNDYFGARYYASSMGRFLSPDWSARVEPVPYAKLENPQSLNLYAYVLNNPMTGRDLDGHVCFFGIGNTCVPTQPPPPPPPPAAPPIAVLKTDIKGNTITFTVSTHEKTTETTIETHVKVTKAALKEHPDAGGEIHSTVKGVENKHAGEDAYGPKGALIDVGDSRSRYIHGGGSGLPDPMADQQGWVPTEGCTRGQNNDVINLGKAITDFQKSNPDMPIQYDRQ